MKTLYQRAFREHRLAVDDAGFESPVNEIAPKSCVAIQAKEMAMRETVGGLGVTCVDTDSRLVRRAGPVLIRPAKMI